MKCYFFIVLLVIVASDVIATQYTTGRPGKQGPAGPKGDRGPRGLPGFDGLDGINGEKGERGICDCADISKFERDLERQEERLNLAAVAVGGWYMIKHGSGYQYWYRLFRDKSSYKDARLKCVKQNAKLAAKGMRITDIRREVVDQLVRPFNQPVWIGLDDLERQNTWVWSDGVTSTRSNTDWGSREPSSSNERCGDFYPRIGFQINDAPCSYSYFYLCEKVIWGR